MVSKKTINMISVATTAFLTPPVETAAASPTQPGASPAATPSATECSDNGAEIMGSDQDATYDMTSIEGEPAERIAADAVVGGASITAIASCF